MGKVVGAVSYREHIVPAGLHTDDRWATLKQLGYARVPARWPGAVGRVDDARQSRGFRGHALKAYGAPGISQGRY